MRFSARLFLILASFAPFAIGDDKPGRLNHLANETSPYLLQHARNPVDWYAWGPEAFAKAKAENKPIFLSVGYSSCFWCHVMERESFEDAEVAKILNAKFVAIKVDREERPDVDAVYMAVLQAFSGHGGWPMTVFLFPDGRPFFAGTYFPPRDRPDREGLIPLLGRAADAWRDQKPLLDKDADTLTKAARKAATLAADRRPVPLTRSILDAGQAALAEQFDPDFGGFGSRDADRPKFPEPSNLVFLLRRATLKNPVREGKSKGPEPLAMVTTTLDHMARGGIRDHLGGGYHRYSVNRGWTVPHFEKMLYDNAQLASVHLRAFELTGDPRWRAEAEATLGFLTGKLLTAEGAFASSIDAETGGDEGAYYVWKKADIQAILGDDFPVFARVYGLDRPSNFEGDRYVLQERLPFDAIDAETRSKLGPMREALLKARQHRPAPRLDDKILTAWNGLTIAAFADGFRLLKNPKYRKIAENAANFLLKTHRDGDGRLLRTSRNGQARGPAYLEDYAFLAHGLLRLHAATGDATRLAQSQQLVDRMIADFSDPAGGFFFTADGGESLIARMKDPFDNALPSGNSVAILDLMNLARLLPDSSYAEIAGKSLRSFSPILNAMPAGAPLMLVGLGEYLDLRGEEGPGRAPNPSKTPSVLTAEATVGKRSDASEVEVTLALRIADGWHIAANPSGSDVVAATEIQLGKGSAWTLVQIEYPSGKSITSPGGGGAMNAFEGNVSVKVRVRLEKAGAMDGELLVQYQPCNDRACLIPATLRVPVSIR